MKIHFIEIMEKLEYRAVIKFLTMEGNSPTKIHERMELVYKDKCPSKATVARWSAEFKHGRESLEDDPRTGAPCSSVNAETIQLVEDIVMDKRRVSQREIADILGILKGVVQTILHQHLNMSKVSNKWVPRILTPQMTLNRLDCSNELLHLSSEIPNFFDRIVTGDESWIHHYDPESNLEAKQWKHAESPTPKRPRARSSAGKIMMTVFWDQAGILLLDFLPHK